MFLGDAKVRKRRAGVLCVLVLCCFVVAGLWPFGHPRNDVTWLSDRDAIRFGEYGTVLSVGPLTSRNAVGCTVEMWLRPSQSKASSTVLAFFSPSGKVGISLHQSLSDLRLDSHAQGRIPARTYISDVFRAGKLVFLTIVSGARGAAVYLDGTLTRIVPEFKTSPLGCSGRFVVGDSPTADDTWEGELGGLAIYQYDFTAERVRLNLESWRNTGRPAKIVGRPDALYLFDEGRGNRIYDHGASGVGLIIPERYVIAQPILLGTPLKSYEGKWDDVQDILINVGGFAPFGFTLSAFLTLSGWRNRVAGITALAGLGVSLTIEVIQAYLPTRNSDLTDVLTNVLGTWLGAMLYRKLSLRLSCFR